MRTDVYSLNEKEVIQTGDMIKPSTLKKISAFFDKRKGAIYNLSKSYCSIFCHDRHDGDTFHENEYLCHRPMNGNFRPGATGFFTMINKSTEPEFQRPMLEFILSDKGPWAEGLKHSSILRDGDKDGFPVGVLLRNPDETNIKNWMNGITATRWHNSWGATFFWNRFMSAGFNEHESLILGSMFTWNGMTLNFGQNRQGMFSSTPHKHGEQATKYGPASTDTAFRYGGDRFYLDVNAFLSNSPDYTAFPKGGENESDMDADSADTNWKNKNAQVNPCNYGWNSRGKFGLKKSSYKNDKAFADPFKLVDFLQEKELASPDARVKEVKDALKLSYTEVVVM